MANYDPVKESHRLSSDQLPITTLLGKEPCRERFSGGEKHGLVLVISWLMAKKEHHIHTIGRVRSRGSPLYHLPASIRGSITEMTSVSSLNPFISHHASRPALAALKFVSHHHGDLRDNATTSGFTHIKEFKADLPCVFLSSILSTPFIASIFSSSFPETLLGSRSTDMRWRHIEYISNETHQGIGSKSTWRSQKQSMGQWCDNSI